VRDAQLHELGLDARQQAAWHQGAGEVEPAAKQPPVPPERGEDLRRLAVRRDRAGSRNQGIETPDLGSVARPNSYARGRGYGADEAALGRVTGAMLGKAALQRSVQVAPSPCSSPARG
jgi:hypothetical protein